MSSILKALEKVEQSQTGRRSSGPSGLARSGKARPAWVLPAGILGGAAVAALVTFAAMGGFSRHTLPAPHASLTPAKTAQPVQPAAAQVKAAVPVHAEPVNSQATAAAKPVTGQPTAAAKEDTPIRAAEQKGAAKSVDGKPKKVREVSAAAPHQAAPHQAAPHQAAPHQAAPHQAAPHQAPARPVPSRSAPVKAATVQAPPAKAVPAPAPVGQPVVEKAPELRVTGIAWQKDSQSSAAIINGQSVQQGTVIDGYKVEQIFEDKVRLSGRTGRLEIPLGAGE
jgi:general secretion pathway protein B